jgi:TolA-binding protein
MVAYKNLSNATEAAQSWLALAALGILGGYAGGILLKRWSESLVASMAKEIEENKKLVNKALGENEQLWQQRRDDEDEILFRALDDAATTKQALDTTAATLLKRRAKEVTETKAKSGLAAVRAEDAMIAAYAAFHSGHYDEAIELLDHVITAKLKDGLIADAENLLGLCYHYQMGSLTDWFEKAESTYKRALQRNPDALTTAILTTNYGYLLSDHQDYAAAAGKLDHVRSQRDALGNRRKLADVAALGAAAAYEKLSIAGDASAKAKAVAALKEIEYPEGLRYLVVDGSIPTDVVAAWKANADVPTGIKSIL